jgi:hypothetical protein
MYTNFGVLETIYMCVCARVFFLFYCVYGCCLMMSFYVLYIYVLLPNWRRIIRLPFLFCGLFILSNLWVNPWTKPQVQIFFLKRASLYALSKGMRMNIVNTEIMPILLILVEVPTILWPKILYQICQMRTWPSCTQRPDRNLGENPPARHIKT